MPTDPGDVDSYTKEEKQRIREEWLKSDAGRRLQNQLKRGERRTSFTNIVGWLFGIGILTLVAW
jgi:hypothetical protein